MMLLDFFMTVIPLLKKNSQSLHMLTVEGKVKI